MCPLKSSLAGLTSVWIWPALLVVACATPEKALRLADVGSEAERRQSTLEATRMAGDRELAPATRFAAMKTLGVLANPTSAVVLTLGRILHSGHEREELRSAAAWALGEMRQPVSLASLVAALRQPMSPAIASQTLEGLAKHAALLVADQAKLVEAVEAMAFYAGNVHGNPPPLVRLLSERLRSIPVNVQVLSHSLDVLDGSESKTAAVGEAAFDLLASVHRSERTIVASPLEWRVRVDEAFRAAQRALRQAGVRTAVLVVWWLGCLSTVAELALPAGQLLAGADEGSTIRPDLFQSPALGFVAAWALYHQALFSPASRSTWLKEFLTRFLDEAIWKLLAQLSPGEKNFDALQKTLVLPTLAGGRPRGSL